MENVTYLREWVESLLNLQLITTIIAIIIINLALYFYFTPANIVKDLSDVGYDHIYKRERLKSNRKRKTEITQDSRRKRVVGNVPPVYPNGWFALLDSDDLKKKEVKHISALGEHFAIFRAENGQVHILDALCPHLGANFAIGGIVKQNCIQCPFHGWEFSGHTGNCVKIPFVDVVPTEAKVKRWFSCEINTIIFVWYHAEDLEPTWFPEPVPNIEPRKWWYRGRNEYYVNVHIQEIPENGADVTHLSVLHGPIVLAGSDLFNMNKWWANIARHDWKASWTSGNGKDVHIGSMQLYTDVVFFNTFKAFKMNIRSDQIGPGYVVMNVETSMGPMIILQTVTPVEPLVQKVVHKMFYPLSTSLLGTVTFFTESTLVCLDVF